MTSPTTEAHHPVEGAVAALPKRQLFIVLSTLMLATFLAALDGTIVTTALPTIAGKLGGFSLFAWVSAAYVVAATITTPILGKLSDLFGRRPVLFSALGVFLLGSVLCALSRSMGQLIAARAVQGLGGGGIQALTFAVMADLVAPRERGRYIGLYTAAISIANLAGPLIGGFFIDHFSWPVIFWFNLPVGAVVIVAIALTLRVPFQRRRGRIDYLGAVLLTGSLLALLFGLERGRDGWGDVVVWLLFVVAGVLTVAFVRAEGRAEEPMLPLRLFRNRIVAVSYAIGALAGTLVFGAAVFLPLFFQDARLFSPTRSGLYQLPVMIGASTSTIIVGRRLVARGRYRRFPILGSAGYLLAAAAIAVLVSADVAYWKLALPMLVIGICSGLTFTPTSAAIQNAVEVRDLGVATAGISFFRQLGGSLGLAVYGTVFNTVVANRLRATLPANTLAPGTNPAKLIRDPKQIAQLALPVRRAIVASIASGVRVIYLCSVPVLVVMFVVSLRLREIPLRTTLDTPAPTE